MNVYKTNNNSQEGVILAIIMSIYILFSIHFLPILLIIVSAPFIIYGVKSDIKSSLLSLIATLLTVGVIFEPVSSLLIFFIFGPYIFINIYLIKKREKATKVVIYSATVLFISFILLFGFFRIGGFDLTVQLKENFTQILSNQMDMLSEMGLTSYEILERRDSLKSEFITALMIFPSIVLIFVFIGSYINYLLASLGLTRIGINILNMPEFSSLRLPDNFILGSLLMILTAFITSKMNISYGDAINANIMVLLGTTFFIQGISVINYFLLKIRMKKFIRVMTYIFIFFSPQIYSGISILGGIDVLFDLRRIKRTKS